jgi:hypothetical protein
MFRAIFRVLFGFVLACLAAGLTQVLFAVGPQEVTGGDPDKLSRILEWSALTATQSAVFAVPFALLSAAISEWQGIRGFLYHTIVGICIAMAGFGAHYFSEAPAANSIMNNYAAIAFAVTGLVAGFVYWLFAGRRAGGPDDDIYGVEPPVVTRTTTSGSVPATGGRTPAAPPPSPRKDGSSQQDTPISGRPNRT